MTSDTLCLTQAAYDEIVAHARAGKPQEVCGILRGRGPQAFQVVRGRNVASDPVKDYTVDPQTLLRQFDFEKGDEMVAIYHSHPATAAYPSASDAWNAHYPDCAYLICSLEDDAAPLVRAFRLIAHQLPLDLAELRAELEFDETRPGLFAYYQAVNTPIPSVLQSVAAQVPLPFYVIFGLPEKAGKNYASRIVSIVEHQVQVVPD